MSPDKKKTIGSILLKQRAVSARELEDELAKGGVGKPPLATRLTEAGTIDEVEALKALSEQSGVPGIDLNQVCIRLADLPLVPRETAERDELLPVLLKGDRLFVAMANPNDTRAVSELEFVTGKKVFPYVALKGTLERVIAEAYDRFDAGERYYAGPKCPPETLRKAGVTPGPPPPPAPAPPAPPLKAADGRVLPPRKKGQSLPPFLEESFHPPRAPANGPARDVPSAVVLTDAMSNVPEEEVADFSDDVDFAEPLVADDPGVGAADASIGAPAQAKPGAVEGRKTLLVVDDEPDVRRLLVRVFAERGYNVLEAEDGEVALRLVQAHVPDALILDAMLPKVHGFEIAQRLKGSDRYGHIPIVMVSAVYRGWRFAEDVKTNYHVEAYLEKPFKVSDVVEAVTKALDDAPKDRGDTDSTSAEAERCLALGLAAFKAGDLEQAVSQLREGTKADPLAYRLRFHLGLLYGKAGQLYDAIQELETVLSIRSGFFPALKNLAVLYQNAGFRNKALEMWERCLAAAPDEETRQTIKRHLVAVL